MFAFFLFSLSSCSSSSSSESSPSQEVTSSARHRMNPQDVNFNSHEQLEILAEVIKSSNVHPGVLVQFIRQYGINPNWGDVALPRGRTINQCSSWFNSIINQPGPSGHGRSQSLQGPPQSVPLKRPFSPDQPSFAGGRLLVPKPPMSAIDTILNQPTEPPKKKRGRPTNAEKAARTQQDLTHPHLLPPSQRPLPTATGSSSNNAITPSPLSIATHAAQAAMTPLLRDLPISASTSERSSGKKSRNRAFDSEQETPRLQQAFAEEAFEPAPAPSRPVAAGPSRYPNILSPDEHRLGEGAHKRQQGSPPGRGDPAAYR